MTLKHAVATFEKLDQHSRQLLEATKKFEVFTARILHSTTFLPGIIPPSAQSTEECKVPEGVLGDLEPTKIITGIPGRPNLTIWRLESGLYVLHFQEHTHGKLFVPHSVQMSARRAGNDVFAKDQTQTARTRPQTVGKAMHSYVAEVARFYEAAAGTPFKYATPFVGRPPNTKRVRDLALKQPEPIATASVMALDYYSKAVTELGGFEQQMMAYKVVINNCRTHVTQSRVRSPPSVAPCEVAGSRGLAGQAMDVMGDVSPAKKPAKRPPAEQQSDKMKKKLRLQFRKQFGFRADAEY